MARCLQCRSSMKTASVVVDGLTYTGTIDRQSKLGRPVVIECSDGQRWGGEWDVAFDFISLDQGEMPDAAKEALDTALAEASQRAR